MQIPCGRFNIKNAVLFLQDEGKLYPLVEIYISNIKTQGGKSYEYKS